MTRTTQIQPTQSLPVFQAGRNIGLDGLRGLCAVAIAAYHFLAWNGLAFSSIGAFGVYIFFILSALTMFMVYGRDFADGVSRTALIDFFQNRCARILPLLFVVSVVAAFWYGKGPEAWTRTVLTGTGMFSLGPPGHLSGTVGAWSLGIELAFYFVFPVIALVLGRASTKTLLIVTGILLTAQQLNIFLLPDDEKLRWPLYCLPITFAPFFALGLVAQRLKLEPSHRNLMWSFCSFVAICTYSSVLPFDRYAGGASYLVLTALSFVAVVAAYNAIVPNRLVRWFLLLGELSYAIYLTHWMTFRLTKKMFKHAPESLFPVKMAVFVALTLGLAYLFNRFVEVPARAKFRASTNRIPSGQSTMSLTVAQAGQ